MHVHRPDVAYRGVVETHGKQWPKRIILHDTESHDAAGIRDIVGVINFWKNQGLGYGAHLVIDSDGNTGTCASPEQTTWHTLHRNTGSIGIEMIGFARFTPKMWFIRVKQLRAVAQWLAWYSHLYNIPLRFDVERGVSRHADQSKAFGGDHYDPGKGFPLGWVIRQANIYKQKGW